MSKHIEQVKGEEVGSAILSQDPAALPAVREYAGELGGSTDPASTDTITELPAALNHFAKRLLDWLIGPIVKRIYSHLLGRMNDYYAEGFDWVHPSARTLANLPAAVESVAKRDIVSGMKMSTDPSDPDAPTHPIPDGLSLAHLICSDTPANLVTEIVDTNKGWVYKDGKLASMLTLLPNTERLVLGMRNITGNGKQINNNTKLRGDIEFPYLERYGQPTADMENGIIANCPNVTGLIMPKLRYINHYSRNGGDATWAMIGNMQGLKKIVFGTITTMNGSWTGHNNFIIGTPKVIHLEFGKGTSSSMNLAYFIPTMALRTDTEAEDYVDLLEDEHIEAGLTTNLQGFLYNFRKYIALRLTDNGSGLTLTLSQTVRDAIHAAESTYGIEDIIVNQKHWTISPAPTA